MTDLPREGVGGPPLTSIQGSGAVTREGDVSLKGGQVAGRDLTVNQYLQYGGPVATALFQLPPDIEDFTGRSAAIVEVTTVLRGQREQVTAVVLSAIAGKGGVGKTALAVHVAHSLAARFPDGQLYVDLRGLGPEQLDPSAVLAEFLRALGLDGRSIPDGLAERAYLYRAGLARRRILVVLDNASSERQIRPLLPGSPTCAVLVTSRRHLSGLEGARTVMLDALEPGHAVELLGKICGTARVAAESAEAQEIVQMCGCLPLAVRIAGARLAQKPHWRLSRLTTRLKDEHNRLGELQAGDLEVRSSFALSYNVQDEEARRLFRLLSLVQTADFPGWVAAPLLDQESQEAVEIVERLVDAQLLEVSGEDATGEIRYRFHDLLRVFARERLADEEPPDLQRTAEERLLGAYLRLAERAHERQWQDGLRPSQRPARRWP